MDFIMIILILIIFNGLFEYKNMGNLFIIAFKELLI